MNFMSLNVRGIGIDAKVKWVRKLMMQHNINFMGLQETQISNHTNIDVKGCWDDSMMDFEGVDSTGRSGGLISIWNSKLFRKSNVIKSRHFLIVIGYWNGIAGNTIIANIYGP